jgi:hypothetical protein
MLILTAHAHPIFLTKVTRYPLTSSARIKTGITDETTETLGAEARGGAILACCGRLLSMFRQGPYPPEAEHASRKRLKRIKAANNPKQADQEGSDEGDNDDENANGIRDNSNTKMTG